MYQHGPVTLEASPQLFVRSKIKNLERFMICTTGFRWLAALSLLCGSAMPSLGGGWPMWRYDAQRSAASPDELPPKLSLHWVRDLPPLAPAWPDQPKMQFDAAYEPIVVGQRLIVGSSHDDSLTAYDTRSG